MALQIPSQRQRRRLGGWGRGGGLSVTSGPLSDVTVVEFGHMMAGPYGTRLLAEAGAEVIKVESPAGDPMRQRTPLRDGSSSYFGALNAGKRSIVLDLKSPAGLAKARELVAEADVLVENNRPGAMRRLGLDYETCKEINGQLIYCSISGYGQHGPKAQHPAYAPILHAASGFDLVNMGYQSGVQVPPSTGVMLADLMAGQMVFGAVSAALMGRVRSGVGDHLDIALMDIMLSTMIYETQAFQALDDGPPRTVYRALRARGGFVIVAAISNRNVEALASAMDRPDLLEDERFATMASREHHWEEFQDLIEQWVADKDAEQVGAYLLDAGIPSARFRTLPEALTDEQVVQRGSIRTAVDSAGTFEYVGAPYLSTAFPRDAAPTPVPELGEYER